MSVQPSSLRKRKNKENIDSHTSDDISSSSSSSSTNSFESRRKSADHEKFELMEINRRQTECLKMLEDEYKKLDDDHQRLQIQYEEIQKKKLAYVFRFKFK